MAALLLILISCHKESYLITDFSPIPSFEKNWQNKELKRQKMLAKKDSTLTFIKYNLMVGTNKVSRKEYDQFLISFEKIFGKDSSASYCKMENTKSALPKYINNISFDQAKSFCKWKTDKTIYHILVQEGIIKLPKEQPLSSDNIIFKDSISSFEEWIKVKKMTVLTGANIDLNSCGELKKVRVFDPISFWEYSVFDSTTMSNLNSNVLEPFLTEECQVEIKGSNTIKNCGFRYVFRPSIKPTSLINF